MLVPHPHFVSSPLQEVVFAPGESSQFIPIHIIDDSVPELDEILEISLFNPSSGAILGNTNTSEQQ